ncbi:MAG TPA: oxygenase MpaB family protein [Anaerolineae bacterium]|nr:oxygenase MpaB family protein [Anaerolineae bacterium]
MAFLTDEQLDNLRLVGDAVPDRIVVELAEAGQIGAVNEMLGKVMRNRDPIPAELPDNVEVWLNDTNQLPEGVDVARLERGASFFVEHGAMATYILSTSSLIECYAAVKGCLALAFTYRLGHNAYRRIGETAQFVIDVCQPGALVGNDTGIPKIQKVRLMHSAVRHLIHETGRWPADYGVPLCQEDLLGTMLTFSHVVVRDLEKLGYEVDAGLAEDYHYMWCVIGEMLGVKKEIIPYDLKTGGLVFDHISGRHQGPSEHGEVMTKALMEFHAENIPGRIFDGITPAVTRYLVGDKVADWMGVRRSRWERFIPYQRKLGRAFDLLDDRTTPVANVFDRIALAFVDRTAFRWTHYQRSGFEIPDKLNEQWHGGG